MLMYHNYDAFQIYVLSIFILPFIFPSVQESEKYVIRVIIMQLCSINMH